MSRKNINYNHKPIPTPPENFKGSSLIYLIASFFNNTEYFNIELQEGQSRFNLNYKGFGYRPKRYYRKRKSYVHSQICNKK